jgi:bifunctional UDP-N-acetylglucosamine pyrophosphorylase/glucosamine-1-phosphate N-acetyltransferase
MGGLALGGQGLLALDRIASGDSLPVLRRRSLDRRALKVAILAAGQGTRMKSDLPKVLHCVAGRPMLGYVVEAALALSADRITVVVGYQAKKVRDYLSAWSQSPEVNSVVQEPQKGTGHALLVAKDAIEADPPADLLVLCGDVPLVTPQTLKGLLERHRECGASVTVLTTQVEDPTGYGRIIRDEATGAICRIVEDRDATPDQRAVREVNAGIYCLRIPEAFPLLEQLAPNNQQGELYLVDLVALFLAQGGKATTVTAADREEVEGVNTRVQLARAEARRRAANLAELMLSGVTVIDPASTFVDWGVTVGADTTLEPGVILRGKTKIGEGSVIGPWSYLVDTEVGRNCRIWASVVEGGTVQDCASVGPYSRIRSGTILGARAQVGNFAEVKESTIGAGSKINHHSYIGDADIGADVNIGAGAVVVNYDGLKKHRTKVGKGAFVGCNTNLVAPLTIGDGAYTGAGSTITKNVPPGDLAVGRSWQTNIAAWVLRRRVGTVSDRAARTAVATTPGDDCGGADASAPADQDGGADSGDQDGRTGPGR